MDVTLSLILACIWVLLAAAVALLPMRRQYAPGFALLIAAPFLLGFIGWQHGPLILLLSLLAAASMFRKPLLYLARRALAGPGRGRP